MAAVTWADVVEFASGLSVVEVGAQLAILAFVNGFHDVGLFGGEDGALLRLLRIYMAAHLAASTAVESGVGGGGLVASESVGGISRSYIYPDLVSSANAFATTPHGRTYNMLIAMSPARVGCAF